MGNKNSLIGGQILLDESQLYLIKQWVFDVPTEQSPYWVFMETRVDSIQVWFKIKLESPKINYGYVVLRSLANSSQLNNRVHNNII